MVPAEALGRAHPNPTFKQARPGNRRTGTHAQTESNPGKAEAPAGRRTASSAHMGSMPKKTKTQPIRPELIEPLTEILRDRGLDVRLWPADEAAAYRDNGRFQEGRDAVQAVRMSKAAAAIEEIIAEAVRAAERKAYLEGISSAQAMRGFTDETFRAILDKEGLDGIDLEGSVIS
jgi:hypothetical protein